MNSEKKDKNKNFIRTGCWIAYLVTLVLLAFLVVKWESKSNIFVELANNDIAFNRFMRLYNKGMTAHQTREILSEYLHQKILHIVNERYVFYEDKDRNIYAMRVWDKEGVLVDSEGTPVNLSLFAESKGAKWSALRWQASLMRYVNSMTDINKIEAMSKEQIMAWRFFYADDIPFSVPPSNTYEDGKKLVVVKLKYDEYIVIDADKYKPNKSNANKALANNDHYGVYRWEWNAEDAIELLPLYRSCDSDIDIVVSETPFNYHTADEKTLLTYNIAGNLPDTMVDDIWDELWIDLKGYIQEAMWDDIYNNEYGGGYGFVVFILCGLNLVAVLFLVSKQKKITDEKGKECNTK